MELLQVNQVSVSSMDLVKAIFDSENLTRSVDDLTQYMVVVALAVLPLFYAISFGWSYARHTISNAGGEKPKFFDKMDLIRGAVLWFMVFTYQPIFGSIEGLAHEIIQKTEPANYQAWKANHGAITVDALTQKETVEEDLGDPRESDDKSGTGMTAILRSIAGGFNQLASNIINQVFIILGFVVSTVVGGLSYLISKIFYVIGPLVIAFSVLPNLKDKLDKWFGVWLGVTLNLLIINLLTTILISVTMTEMEAMGKAIAQGSAVGMSGNSFALLIFNAIVIVLYILSFWLTSFIVGTSDAGKVLSTAAGFATNMIGNKIGGMASAAAGGAGGGAAVNKTASVIDSLKNTK